MNHQEIINQAMQEVRRAIAAGGWLSFLYSQKKGGSECSEEMKSRLALLTLASAG